MIPKRIRSYTRAGCARIPENTKRTNVKIPLIMLLNQLIIDETRPGLLSICVCVIVGKSPNSIERFCVEAQSPWSAPVELDEGFPDSAASFLSSR